MELEPLPPPPPPPPPPGPAEPSAAVPLEWQTTTGLSARCASLRIATLTKKQSMSTCITTRWPGVAPTAAGTVEEDAAAAAAAAAEEDEEEKKAAPAPEEELARALALSKRGGISCKAGSKVSKCLLQLPKKWRRLCWKKVGTKSGSVSVERPLTWKPTAAAAASNDAREDAAVEALLDGAAASEAGAAAQGAGATLAGAGASRDAATAAGDLCGGGDETGAAATRVA